MKTKIETRQMSTVAEIFPRESKFQIAEIIVVGIVINIPRTDMVPTTLIKLVRFIHKIPYSF